MLKYILPILLLTSFSYGETPPPKSPSDVKINLINPTWSQNVFSTLEGGVVSNDDIRVQARHIRFKQVDAEGNPTSLIEATGDLMIEKDGKIFIGERFEYDFQAKEGAIYQGQTAIDIWFFKSSRILFKHDGEVILEDAKLTTCESDTDYWKIKASKIFLDSDKTLTAKNVSFYLGPVPFFWVPFFKSELTEAKSPSLKLTLRFGGKDDNRLGIRYRIWEANEWSTYFRLAYHVARGFGGGLELHYKNPEENRYFVSQNFYAKDRSFNEHKKRNRYQFAGNFHEIFREGQTHVDAAYDKTSDDTISRDYYTNDYKIQSVGNTYIKLSNRETYSIQTLRFQYRVNNFQTVKQELPSLLVNFRPYSIPYTRAFVQSQLQAEYLDFAYAKGTPGIKEFSAPRLRFTSMVHQPIHLAPIYLSPYAGISTAFYGNNPEHSSTSNYFFRYGLSAKTQVHKAYEGYRHVIYPFAEYEVITAPSKPLSSHYIFDYEDAFSKIQKLSYGIRQVLYKSSFSEFPQTLEWSIYTHTFLGKTQTKRRTPRLYSNLTWVPTNRLSLFLHLSYYRLSKDLDLVNSGFAYTFNDDYAFRAEFQHRTKYSWLKANPESFILDVTRSEEELLNSALSKPQNSLITTSHYRLHPDCSLLLETRNGWKRHKSRPYTEWKAGVELQLKCHWQVELSMEHTTQDNRFGIYFSLLDSNQKMAAGAPIW